MFDLRSKSTELAEAAQILVSDPEFNDLMDDVLNRVVIETIRTYQTKLNVGVADSVADLLQNFKAKVAEEIFETVSGWQVEKGEPFLLPRNTRFCAHRGKNTIFVIEEQPQCRTLNLHEKLTLETNNDYEPVSPSFDFVRFHLAMPYVLFMIHFHEGNFKSAWTWWRTRPLNSLNDDVKQPILTNVHKSGQICWGDTVSVTDFIGKEMCEVVEIVIRSFWASRFNNDLSRRWWEKDLIDARLVTPQLWAETSRLDPNFILHLNFGDDDLPNIQTMIERCVVGVVLPDESLMRQALNEKVDATTDALFHRILNYFKKTKFDRFHPKDIKGKMSEVFKRANAQLIDLVLALGKETEEIRQEVESCQRPNVFQPQSKGPFWSDYSA